MEESRILQPSEAPAALNAGDVMLEQLSRSLERDARLYPAPMQA